MLKQVARIRRIRLLANPSRPPRRVTVSVADLAVIKGDEDDRERALALATFQDVGCGRRAARWQRKCPHGRPRREFVFSEEKSDSAEEKTVMVDRMANLVRVRVEEGAEEGGDAALLAVDVLGFGVLEVRLAAAACAAFPLIGDHRGAGWRGRRGGPAPRRSLLVASAACDRRRASAAGLRRGEEGGGNRSGWLPGMRRAHVRAAGARRTAARASVWRGRFRHCVCPDCISAPLRPCRCDHRAAGGQEAGRCATPGLRGRAAMHGGADPPHGPCSADRGGWCVWCVCC